MAKLVHQCMNCGRSYERHEKVQDDFNISHGLCTKCVVADSEQRDLYTSEELLEIIKKEIREGTDKKWSGEWKPKKSDKTGEDTYESFYKIAKRQIVIEDREKGGEGKLR